MTLEDPIALTAKCLGHVPHGFFGRRGGRSGRPYASLNQSLTVKDDVHSVLTNRRRAAAALGLRGPVTFVRQEHKTRVVDAGEILSDHAVADGLTSGGTKGAIGILTADCVPLLLATPDGQQVLALHAGWRGLAQSIVCKSISVWCARLGVLPRTISAAIGPAIGPCCFEVRGEALAALSVLAPAAVHLDKGTKTRARADLFAASRTELARAGLLPQNVDTLELCTRCADARYFSYRREQVTGRQAAIIAPRPLS